MTMAMTTEEIAALRTALEDGLMLCVLETPEDAAKHMRGVSALAELFDEIERMRVELTQAREAALRDQQRCEGWRDYYRANATLRDDLAMAALKRVGYCPTNDDRPGERELDLALACYRIADAMLKAREVQP